MVEPYETPDNAVNELNEDYRDVENGNDKDNGKAKTKGNGRRRLKSKTESETESESESEQHKKFRKEIIARRYAENGFLYEAIIIGRSQKFAVAVPRIAEKVEMPRIVLEDLINFDENTVIKPPQYADYIDRPYVFKSLKEFQELIEIVKIKNLDELYEHVKSMWQKYVDADDFHISICAADTIFTYFQDKIGLTHYLFFVGGNTSGKSNNLTILHYLAYRNMTSSDLTAANIYQFLGSGEEGLGTICEDEADDIDEDIEKMRIYKNGYTTGRPVLRTDTNLGRRQFKFNTFCFKAFAAEKLPDSTKAKGFNERTIELPCTYGFPKEDISEVVNSAGDDEFQGLLDELNKTRNMLLIYRLLHFDDKIPNLRLNIENREKQLFKPIIRIFQNSKTLEKLLPVVSKYVNQKREAHANTLHAFLYKLVRDLVTKKDKYELESVLVWNTLVERLQGKEIPSKPQSCDTSEFGVVSQKGVTEVLVQVFGAKKVRKHSGRMLLFDRNKLDRLSKIYDLSIDVQVETSSSPNSVTHVSLVGLDRHLNEQSKDNKIADPNQQNQNSDDKSIDNIKNIITEQNDKTLKPSPEVSQASQASRQAQPQLESESTNQSYDDHKLENIVTWSCRNCYKFKTTSQKEYDHHTVTRHPGKAGYPDRNGRTCAGPIQTLARMHTDTNAPIHP